MKQSKHITPKSLWYDNLVLERGLLLSPIVVMAYNLKNAVSLSVAFILITFVTVLISTLIPKAIPYTIRVVINVIIAAVVFIPTAMLINWFEANLVYNLGIFLPLLIINSLVVQKSETRFRKAPSKLLMIEDLLYQLLSFAVVAVLLGAVREFFGNGSLWGVHIGDMPVVSVLLLPFSGFIMIGLLSALAHSMKQRQTAKAERGGDQV